MRIIKLLTLFTALVASVQNTNAFLFEGELVKLTMIAGKCVATNALSGVILGTVTGGWGFVFNTATCTGMGYLQYSGPQGTLSFAKDIITLSFAKEVGKETAISCVGSGLFNTKNLKLLGIGKIIPSVLTKVTKIIGGKASEQIAKKAAGAEVAKTSGKVLSLTQKIYNLPIINAVAGNNLSKLIRK